ncbi:MAG: chloride channel protein [Prochlorococcus sp.]|nr:chloride channel protein [Prochlorococcaceae cyanobacterium Fu_MAG_50]
MSKDHRRFNQLIPGVFTSKGSQAMHLLQHLLVLTAIGLLIGLACWPLGVVDRLQVSMADYLPTGMFASWSGLGLLLILLPIPVMPVLLLLQRGPWKEGAGSGIPQTMSGLEDPSQLSTALGTKGTIKRAVLWSVATLALLPLGREGPVVHVGAAIARAAYQRWQRWLPAMKEEQMVAIGGGAGLAGGFNTPLLGILFTIEELTAEYSVTVIWPALVIGVGAAGMSNLFGQPMFSLGVFNVIVSEPELLLMALPIGLAGGLAGGFFNRTLVWSTGRMSRIVQDRPIAVGLILGACLSVLSLASWGMSTGDGEALLSQIINDGISTPDGELDRLSQGGMYLWITVVRVLGPILALAPGIPGGLIDPSLAFGGVLGHSICALLGVSTHLGIGLGLAAGLAGATQLPLVSMVFAWRMVGDQQLFAGVILAAVLGSYVGRLIARKPVYHALAELYKARL